MIRCLIIDDEEAGRFLLAKKIRNQFPELEVVQSVDSINSALNVLKNTEIDLVFLDIQLRGVNGFDLLDRLPKRSFEVIFVTAYDEFALQAFQKNALYYIHKPIQDDELRKGIEKAIATIDENRKKTVYTLYLSTETSIDSVGIDEILCIQSQGAYSLFHLEDRTVLTSKNIGYYEALLPENNFLRTHHSYIVNVTKIKSIVKSRNGTISLKNDLLIPISQRKLKIVMAKLGAAI